MTQKRWQQGDVRCDGVDIHYYRTGGDKPQVVLCHGLTDNGMCWQRLAAQLEVDFDLIMLDARNHGLSGAGSASLQELVADVAAVIRALNLDKPAAIGHSVGAAVVAGLAAFHLDLVSRIVLEDPPWRVKTAPTSQRRDQKSRAAFAKWVEGLADLPREQVIAEAAKQYPDWHEDDLPAWADSKVQIRLESMQSLDLGDWQEIVPQIQCPALLVYAEAELGGIVTAEIAAQVSALNSRFDASAIAGAGHNIRRERFDAFSSAVATYLHV